MKQNRHYPGP